MFNTIRKLVHKQVVSLTHTNVNRRALFISRKVFDKNYTQDSLSFF